VPLSMALWKISADKLAELPKSKLNSEARLEDWIAADTSILGLDVLIIGRQVATAFGGRIDLLVIDQKGDLVILELKRDRTPRDIVAQVLDYATWVKDLTPKDIDAIASAYLQESLAVAFAKRFGVSLPESINSNHGMVIIASELDDSSERIVQYLATVYGVNINAIFFSFFRDNDNELVGRAWLLDPEDVVERSESRTQPPWTGYWFVNVDQNWDDCRAYSFLSAGNGKRYSGPLQDHLDVGDKVFAYLAGSGYVGFGQVTSMAVPAKDFAMVSRGAKLFELDLREPRIRENCDDPDLCYWVVGIKWIKAFPRGEARTFRGRFANPNIVCKLRHQATLDFLRKEFGVGEEEPVGEGVAPT